MIAPHGMLHSMAFPGVSRRLTPVFMRAGKGRMFKCLQESLAQPDFGQACRAQVEERGQRMQEDYRLDYGVAQACESDVTTYCAAEKVHTRQSQGVA